MSLEEIDKRSLLDADLVELEQAIGVHKVGDGRNLHSVIMPTRICVDRSGPK